MYSAVPFGLCLIRGIYWGAKYAKITNIGPVHRFESITTASK
jgi:hypothetical protein